LVIGGHGNSHEFAPFAYAKMQKLRKNLGDEILIILGGLLGAIVFLAVVGLATYLLISLKKSAFSF